MSQGPSRNPARLWQAMAAPMSTRQTAVRKSVFFILSNFIGRCEVSQIQANTKEGVRKTLRTPTPTNQKIKFACLGALLFH
jgi:hypothetical protein